MDFWFLILVIPAMILSLAAQAGVNSSYKKNARIFSSRGMTGREAAEMILRNNGIYDVRIEPVSGSLTDHYSPREQVIRLSEGVYDSSSVAAIGIASHEAGHAVQHHVGYVPIKIRNAVLPVANIGSMLAFPLIVIGFLLSSFLLLDLGVIFFSFTTLFQLITLPVEFNASSRAVKAIEANGVLYGEELNGAKSVLRAAAMTYVAALAVSFAQLLRFFFLTRSNRR